MKVEIASPQDADIAKAIAQRAFAPYLARMDQRPAPMDADFRAAAQDGSLRVLHMGGAICGYILSFANGRDWQVENLAIAPEHQGAGYGVKLLAEAEVLARQAGCDGLTLYTNVVMTEAIAFYQRSGFLQIGRRRVRGFDRVYFRRPLNG